MSSIAFDCTQRHVVFEEQCYMREIDEFDCLQLHSKTCSIWGAVLHEGNR